MDINLTPRENLLGEKKKVSVRKKETSNLVFSTPFSVEFKSISNIIRKYLPILESDPMLSEILGQGCKIVAKKAPTIGNVLAPSLVQTERPVTHTWLNHPGCFKCGHRICTCCKFIKVTDSFKSVITEQDYKIQYYINCNTTFVVYMITCNKCCKQYIGSTKCSLKTRIRRHLSDINSLSFNQISAVSFHFIQVHNKDTTSMSVQGIERVVRPARGGDHVKKLRSREMYWMFILRTYQPNGLNRRYDLDLYY